MTGTCDTCTLRHEHEHGENGWRVTVGRSANRHGGPGRWWYSLDDTTDRRRPGFSSHARYGSRESALAAGHADAKACR